MTVIIFLISILSTIGGVSAFICEEISITGLVLSITFFFEMILLCILYLPTLLSYHCYVNDYSLSEEYLILFLERYKDPAYPAQAPLGSVMLLQPLL